MKKEWIKSEGDQEGKSSSKKKKNITKVESAKKMKLEKPRGRNRTVKEEGE